MSVERALAGLLGWGVGEVPKMLFLEYSGLSLKGGGEGEK